MASTGDTFETQDGQSLTVVRGPTETGGELLELASTWEPMDHRPPAHFHPHQDERFEVLEGELTVELDGQRNVIEAGATVEVPRGTVHKMWNGGAGPCRAMWQVRPALRTAELFAAMDASRAFRRSARGGGMTPLGAGRVLSEFGDEFRLAVPGGVARPLLALLAVLARVRGYPPPRGSAGHGPPPP